MNATPRPWKHSAYLESNKDYPDRLCGHYVEGPRGEGYVAYMMPNTRGVEEINAALIVRAVNSFDAMREALQLIVAWNRSGGASSLEEARELTYRKAQAALALAKGER